MPKNKILYFSHSPYLFGAENCLLSLVKSLDKERFEAVVVLPADGPLKKKLDELAVRTHILPLEWWVKNEGRFLYPQNETPQRLDQLLRIISDETPDVIHTNTSVIWLGAVAARMLGIRQVWHLHEMLVDHPSLEPAFPLPLLYHSIDFLSDRVVAVSDELRRELCGYASPEKVKVIYNGVTPCQVDKDAADSLRLELTDGEERVIATTVTSLQKYKGIDHLLAAAAEVVKQRPEVLFLVAGTGPREAISSLTDGIKNLGLEKSVRYLGFREDVPQLLAASDIFVLPSLKEAFPLVVLEAMSQGKPVVTTDCGGTAEMVTDGETGFVVPVAAPTALAEKIMELVADREKMAEMGSRGLARFEESFTLGKYVEGFEKLYDEVLAGPKPVVSTREHSLINAFLSGYQSYSKAIRTLPEKETALTTVTGQAGELRAQLADREMTIQQMKGEVARLAAERGRQDGNLQQKDHELAQQEQALQQKVHELAQQEQALQQKVHELAQQEQALQQKDVELKERDERVSELSEELANLDVRLSQLAGELKCAGELRVELESWLDHKSSEIVTRDDRIKQIREDMILAREERAELGRKLQQQNVELAERNERLRQIWDEVAREEELIQKELRQKDDEVRRLQASHAEDQQRIARLTEELKAAKQVAQEKEQRVEDLLNSISWKVTAPLRTVYDLARSKKQG